MKAMTEMLKTFWTDEAGMEMSEYAVVGVLIALGTAGAFLGLRDAIGPAITRIATCITTGVCT
jgi:Flp pilus assembly pilin Flp